MILNIYSDLGESKVNFSANVASPCRCKIQALLRVIVEVDSLPSFFFWLQHGEFLRPGKKPEPQ